MHHFRHADEHGEWSLSLTSSLLLRTCGSGLCESARAQDAEARPGSVAKEVEMLMEHLQVLFEGHDQRQEYAVWDDRIEGLSYVASAGGDKLSDAEVNLIYGVCVTRLTHFPIATVTRRTDLTVFAVLDSSSI